MSKFNKLFRKAIVELEKLPANEAEGVAALLSARDDLTRLCRWIDGTGIYSHRVYDDDGFDLFGFDADGMDREGYSVGGLDEEGYTREGKEV